MGQGLIRGYEAKEPLPPSVAEAASLYVASRRSTHRLPPAIRLERATGNAIYLRVFAGPPPSHHEIIVLREEIMRDADLYRELEALYGITQESSRSSRASASEKRIDSSRRN
jgi:hypothetical protein